MTKGSHKKSSFTNGRARLTLSGPRFFRYRKDRGEGGVDSTPSSISLKIGS